MSIGSLLQLSVIFVEICRCDNVINILLDLYNSTRGDHWYHQWNITRIKNGDYCYDQFGHYQYGIHCANEAIIKIQLNNNNLNGTIPDSIGNLTSWSI